MAFTAALPLEAARPANLLIFNHEAHIEPVYQISAQSDGARINDSTNFPAHFLTVDLSVDLPNLYQIRRGHRAVIVFNFFYSFQTRC